MPLSAALAQKDVSSVKYMSLMFRNNAIFNQDLSSWDVSSLVITNSMFEGAAEGEQQRCALLES